MPLHCLLPHRLLWRCSKNRHLSPCDVRSPTALSVDQQLVTCHSPAPPVPSAATTAAGHLLLPISVMPAAGSLTTYRGRPSGASSWGERSKPQMTWTSVPLRSSTSSAAGSSAMLCRRHSAGKVEWFIDVCVRSATQSRLPFTNALHAGGCETRGRGPVLVQQCMLTEAGEAGGPTTRSLQPYCCTPLGKCHGRQPLLRSHGQ